MHTQPSGAGRPRMTMGARKKRRNLPPSRRKHRFLREFKRVGTLSAGCRAAGVSYGEMLTWLNDEKFRRRLSEAKLVFTDRLEELLTHRIMEEDDAVALRFKLRAELGDKYGGLPKPATPAEVLTMWRQELERETGRASSAF